MASADFLVINGIRIDVKVLSVDRSLEYAGELAMAGAGEILDQRRQGRRTWKMTTTCQSRAEARALQALIEGFAHALPFDGGLEASTSLMPRIVADAGDASLRPDGGRGGGCLYCTGNNGVQYREAVLAPEDWTLLGWAVAVATRVTHHVALRSDGAAFVDGVRAVALATGFPLLFSSSNDEILIFGADVNGNLVDMEFSDCVIVKATLPDEWIAQVAAWDTYWGPAPLVHCEGSMIDSPLGIFANGNVSGGAFVQRGGMGQRGGVFVEDQTWDNNELELAFSISEDNRSPGIDYVPLAELYAPLTERVDVDTSTATVVVTNNALNDSAGAVRPTLIDGPTPIVGDDWPRWVAAGASLGFAGAPAIAVDATTSRLSVSVWLWIPTALGAQSLVAVIKLGSPNREWKLAIDAGGHLLATIYDDSVPATITTTMIDAVQRDTWIHVVMVHDTAGVLAGLVSNEKLALFVNGDQPTCSYSQVGAFVAVADGGGDLLVPDGLANDLRYGFAHLASFGLRALTRAQIRTLYRLGRRGQWLRRV